jgi:hypothetical protein
MCTEDNDDDRMQRLLTAIARPIAYGCLSSEAAPSLLVHFSERVGDSAFAKGLLSRVYSKLKESANVVDWKLVSATLKKVLLQSHNVRRQLFHFFFFLLLEI